MNPIENVREKVTQLCGLTGVQYQFGPSEWPDEDKHPQFSLARPHEVSGEVMDCVVPTNLLELDMILDELLYAVQQATPSR